MGVDLPLVKMSGGPNMTKWHIQAVMICGGVTQWCPPIAVQGRVVRVTGFVRLSGDTKYVIPKHTNLFQMDFMARHPFEDPRRKFYRKVGLSVRLREIPVERE